MSLLGYLGLIAAVVTVLVLAGYLVAVAVLLRRATRQVEAVTAGLRAVPQRGEDIGLVLARVSLQLDRVRGTLRGADGRLPVPDAPVVVPGPREEARAEHPTASSWLPEGDEGRAADYPTPIPTTSSWLPEGDEGRAADYPTASSWGGNEADEDPGMPEGAATRTRWDVVPPEERLAPPPEEPGVRKAQRAARGFAGRLKGRKDSG